MSSKSIFTSNKSNTSILDKYFFNTQKSINNNNSKQNRKLDYVYPLKEFSKCFRYYVMPYLALTDIITLKTISKLFNILINDKAIKLLIISNSIKHFSTHTLRYAIWSHYLSLNQFFQETISLYHDQYNSFEEFYSYLLGERDKLKSNSQLSYQTKDKTAFILESFDYINRDVTRTFYNDRFTNQNGQEELRNVLEISCLLKDNVGYCQGMNFVCGAFICLFRSESKAFWVFNTLLKQYELNNLFAYVCRTLLYNHFF